MKYGFGVDLGGTTVKIAYFDETGNMLEKWEIPTVTEHEDGSKTYTIKIKSGLKYSDGSEITAKDYIAATLANSTAVSKAAGGTGAC